MVDSLGGRLRLRVDDRTGLWSAAGRPRRLDFTYVDWEAGITEVVQPNYANTDVVGRAESYRHWIATGNKDLQITFQFRVQEEGEEAIRREVIRPVRFLEALKFPLYNAASNLSVQPPDVILTIGRLFSGRVKLTAGDIQWQTVPHEPRSLLPHGALFPATFTVVRRQQDDLSYKPEMFEDGVWD